MLIIEHKAPHLYLEDSYKDFCWLVDNGLHTPISYIYLRFQGFSEMCSNYNLKLVQSKSITNNKCYSKEFNDDLKRCKYFGLITRVENMADVNIIKNALSHGRNVIGLLPSEKIMCWYNGDEHRIKEAIYAAKELKVNKADEKITPKLANHSDLLWFEEINIDNSGRLFITKDSFLSNAYLTDDYGSSYYNLSLIKRLIKNFATFKYSLMSVSIRNNISIWPTNEPFTLIIDVLNHGPKIDYAEILIDVPDSFEPLTSTERIIKNLGCLKKTSLSFQIIPRVDGNYENFLKVKIKSSDDTIYPASFIPIKIEIYPSLGDFAKNQNKQDDHSLSRLVSISKKMFFSSEVNLLPSLMKVDAQSCLNKIRSIAEGSCYKILSLKKIELKNKKFSSAIELLQKNRILSSKSIGYLNTIRKIGNLASHPTDETFTDNDVRLVSHAFSCVIEEIVERKLI